jgi:hypothetical protein
MIRDDDEIRSTVDLKFLDSRGLVGGKQLLSKVWHGRDRRGAS